MPSVTLPIANGSGEAAGYLATPPGGTGPGVLVLHAWWGLTAPFRAVCDRLAAAGFVALAPDLYDGTIVATIAEAEARVAANDRDALRARAEVGLDYLRALPVVRGERVGLAGFSLGGGYACALAAAHPERIGAVAIFYDDSGLTPGMRPPVIGHIGTADEFAAEMGIDALAEQWHSVVPSAELHRYPGAQHWFAEENQPDYYDPAATELAWGRTIDLFARALAR